MSVLRPIIRGVDASAVGTLAMDALLYRRYRHGGGQSAFLAWESSEGVETLGDHATYGSFATFSDPDGNEWLLQEITRRLPGRIDAAETAFASTADLASAMRRASEAHGAHEARMGGARDENWPDWYAAYMVAAQAGTDLPT